jgi:hypothetical protein
MKSKKPHHQHAVAKRKPATHVVAPWLFTMMLLAWWLGAYGAVVYGVMTDRGPFAIALRLESGIFGGSNAILTALLAAFVIFLCKFACNSDPLRGGNRVQFRPL